MKNRFFFILFLVTLFAGSSYAQPATIHFYRLKNVLLANTDCMVIVNDTSKFSLSNGSYHTLVTDAPAIDIVTSLTSTGTKKLTLDKGKTYYMELDIQNNTSVNLALRDEFSGKPAVERLEADRKAEEIKSASLQSIKVTAIEALPEPEEGTAKIYLFRPFHVIGVTSPVKVTDGEAIYEVKNFSSHVISSDKKEVTLTTVQEGKSTSNSSLKLKLEKGQIYYVAILRSGGAVILTNAKREIAKKEMKL